ncbi:MAG: hypothetical protein ACXWDL_10845 [Nocardioides sp.]
MTLTPRLGALAAVLLLGAGCSGDDDPVTQPTGPPTAETTATAAEPVETGDPLSFASSRGIVTFSCFPQGFRRMVFFDSVRTDRMVTLTGLTTEGDALRVTDTYLAPLPPRAIDESGALDLDAGGTAIDDIDAWADREPLEGATLEPGTRYSFFAVTRLLPDRTLDDLELGWDDGGTTGTSAYDFRGRTRSGGC